MENIITFKGQNVQLFSKMAVQNYSAKTAIIVPETHNAILVKDGQMLQTLSSGKYLIGKFVDVKNELESNLEILFMSKTAKLKLMWGTANKFVMYDSTLQENYGLGMSGDFDVQIGDPRKCYLYLVGADNDLTSDALQERLMSTVVSTLENIVIEYVEKNKVMFNQISACKREISAQAQKQLNQKLMSDYGIAVFSFNIANIIIGEEDLQRLNQQYKQLKKTDNFVCRECGAVLHENDKFCSSCGKRVEIGKKCPNCFTENADDAKFCSSCGQKL
ncbi:MAG: SPFH domain-containing protein [Candidatus Caccovivens sp.]